MSAVTLEILYHQREMVKNKMKSDQNVHREGSLVTDCSSKAIFFYLSSLQTAFN